MDLVGLLVVLIIFGLVLWLVETVIPMPAYMRTVIRVVAVLILCIYLLRLVGVVTIR